MENKKLTNPIMIRSGEITPLAIAAISTMGCINKPSNKGNRYQILIVPRMPAISMNRILDPNPLATAKNESEIQNQLTNCSIIESEIPKPWVWCKSKTPSSAVCA